MADTDHSEINRAIREAAGYRSEGNAVRIVVTTDGHEVPEDQMFPWERIDVNAMVRRGLIP